MKAILRATSISIALLAVGASTASFAQSARSGGSSSANADALRQVQQLASERSALKAENDQLKKELDEARKERDALKSGRETVSARVLAAQSAATRSAKERESTESELTQLKAKMQELIAKFRETAQTMKALESERAAARQALEQRDREMKVCVDRNVALYKLNDEVLTRFDSQSPMACVAGAEPFTRIQRTRLENLIDEYRSRADDQKLPPTPRAAETN
jgi:chromosome segregation ATPase